MTTATRWWTPAEPGIGPDEFDLSLLEPGGEPVKDLGQYLLAVHRIGAAACEAVATQPLADEVTLRGVLATARQMLAEPVSTAVAKAFDQPAYGPMLLAEVLDDAEQAVVSIYRTCITKNVAPSVAAHRAGLIYGVPLRELGRYTMVATDPKADKVAVEELADRALFTFVSKTVADEAPTGAKELVSKAPARERPTPQTQVEGQSLQQLFDQAETREAFSEDDPSTPYFDARNRAGEFARTGKPAVARRTVGRRTVGRRTIASQRPTATPAQTTSQMASSGMATSRMKTTKEKRARLTTAQRRLQSLLPALTVPPTSVGTGHDVDPLAEYLSRVPDHNAAEHDQLWTELSFVFPGDEWNSRKRGMGLSVDEDGNETVLFRARALEGAGPFAVDDNGHLAGEHHHAREHTAALIRERPEHKGQPKALTKTIEGAASSLRSERDLLAAKQGFLRELEGKLGRRLNMSQEIGFVQTAASHDDADDLVLVWQPPTPGQSALARPLAVVTEIYIEDDSARGRMDQTRYGADIAIDPNQPLQAIGGRLLWRDAPDGGFFIRQIDVVEGSEPEMVQAYKDLERGRKRSFGGKRWVVSKAVNERSAEQLRELQRLFDRAEDYYGADPGERNESTGEFQRKGAGVNRRVVGRRQVGRREVARAELAETGRAELKTSQMATSRLKTTPMSQAQLKTAAEAVKAGADGQTVYLDDGFHYTVLDREQLDFLLQDSSKRFLEDAYAETFRPGLSSTQMITDKWKASGADQARMGLISEAELRFRDTPSAGWKQIGDSYVTTTDKDLPAIALDLEDRLGRDPKIQMLRSVIHRRGEEYVITIHGNAESMGDGHLIRMETGSEGPIVLRSEGFRRLTNARGIEHWLQVRWHGGRHIGATGSTDFLPVPLVHTWAAEDTYDAP